VSADAIPGEEYCDRPVGSIVFSGNKTTQPQVLLREIEQLVDEACSLDKIVDSTQGIMDLGLFKSVFADLSLVDDQLQLRFTIKEKLYYLVIPRISRTSDGELRGGAQLRLDNFLGRLHQVKVTSERRKEDDGNGPGGFIHRLNYNIPRFFGSDYGLGFDVFSDRRQLDLSKNGTQYGTAQSETEGLSMHFSRWIGQGRGVQGLRYFFGFRFRERELTVLEGNTGPYSGGKDMAWVVGVENKKINRDQFRRRGTVVGAEAQVAADKTGSDFDYVRADFYGRLYRPLSGGIRNLNVQARIGVSNGYAYGESSYHIGGGEVLRGLVPGKRSGDVLALLNVEYLQALYLHPQWRWVVFADAGNVYDRKKVNLLNLTARTGIGLRWKFEALSNTDVRLDVAWDHSRNAAKMYVSSNLTF